MLLELISYATDSKTTSNECVTNVAHLLQHLHFSDVKLFSVPSVESSAGQHSLPYKRIGRVMFLYISLQFGWSYDRIAHQ